jgi:hypothetical protein
MIGLPSGVRVWLACGCTDMRKGTDGLTLSNAERQNKIILNYFCWARVQNSSWTATFTNKLK